MSIKRVDFTRHWPEMSLNYKKTNKKAQCVISYQLACPVPQNSVEQVRVVDINL